METITDKLDFLKKHSMKHLHKNYLLSFSTKLTEK